MLPSLEYFVCIARHNNITRAAEELHMTQQSLSNYLKKLEEYYGLPLFTRKPVMALTAFGQSVFDRACMIENIHGEIDSMRLYHQESASIRVGFSIIHIYRAMDLFNIPKFQAIFHDAVFRFRHANQGALAQALGRGELDLYYTSYMHSPKYPTADMRPTVDFMSKEVAVFKYKAIVSPKLVRECYGRESEALLEKWKDGVTLKELSHMPLILLKQLRNPTYTDANKNNYVIHLRADTDNVHLAMEMVSLGMGFSIIPHFADDFTQRHSFLQFPVTEPDDLCSQSILCCTTGSALKRPYIQDLWDMI